MVKTDPPNLYKPPARFAVVKTHTPNLLLVVYYELCGGQNAHSEDLLAYYGFCGGQNARSEALQPPLHALRVSRRTLQIFTSLLHTLKRNPKFYKPPTRFAVVKTYSLNLYNPPTRFAVIKTHTPNNYILGYHGLCGRQNALSSPRTRVAVLKTHSPNLLKPPTLSAVVKTDTINLYYPLTRLADVKTF